MVCGRISSYDSCHRGTQVCAPPHGYCLQLLESGAWKLFFASTQISSGAVSAEAKPQAHKLALTFAGRRLTASIDGDVVVDMNAATNATGGMIAIGSGRHVAFFDDLLVEPHVNDGAVPALTIKPDDVLWPGFLYGPDDAYRSKLKESVDSWVWDSAQAMWVVVPGKDAARDAEHGPHSAKLWESAQADPLATLTASDFTENSLSRTVLHDLAPSIVQYDEFFSPGVAADIIRAASDRSAMQTSQFGREGGVVWLPHRNTTSARAAVVELVGRISQLVGIESERAESMQVAWCE